jgi:glycerol-3-phosphate acyltransferase PlsY
MLTIAAYAIIAAVAYFIGSIPFGLLIANTRGIDIRTQGSGNIGATNVWRVCGRKYGLLTFAADVGKGLIAVLLGAWLARRFPGAFRDEAFAGITAAIGCILGHSFPIWLGFKGGKGVATSLGVIIGMMPLASVLVFALWAVIFKVSRYVSLASIVAAAALPVVVVVLRFAGRYGDGHFYFACAAAALVVHRHRGNIQRLCAGTENRFGEKRVNDAAPSESDEPSDRNNNGRAEKSSGSA